ncbi:hypothetical protein [Pseudodesulfovibrio sediminis]|uniref:PilZ domain-containing protein n=1 Tax=Pseudodesulfovibrio sediminis TaxID=2810563 RepID=A0ABN6EUF0_9BACT|nr:hypothetical protein [Pseudodesulfovibrio sediminis]BCS89122.1 hypothetical protein PSDVSF_23640 [Pseudodesulfovibrio sediminis]
MNDEIGYCVPKALALRVNAIAREAGTSPEALLKGIVERFVRQHDSEKERRACSRIDISIPAVICVEKKDINSSIYQLVTIKDISSDGVRLICPGKKVRGQYVSVGECSLRFKLVFTFSEEMEPMKLKCSATRVELVKGDVHILAQIIQAYTKS